jgi:hypothetical protein
MTLLGFKTILHKKCRSGKNSEGPAENSWVLSSKMKTNFKKSAIIDQNRDKLKKDNIMDIKCSETFGTFHTRITTRMAFPAKFSDCHSS